MEYWMEVHCHTATGSGCGKIPPEEIAWLYKAVGYYGIVITDHISLRLLNPGDREEYRFKVDRLVSGYQLAKKNGPKGFPILLGAEIGLGTREDKNDYLLYGLDERFLYNSIEMCEMSLKQMSEYLHRNNRRIYQAHPFRGNCTPADPLLLDGAEAFNDPRHGGEHNILAYNWAKANNLQQISGSDCHTYGSVGSGGLCFTHPIDTNEELLAALSKGDFKIKRNYDME